MSFFVSDSLKGNITESDLFSDDNNKNIQQQEVLQIQFYNDDIEQCSFKTQLVEADFNNKIDKIKIITDIKTLANVLSCDNNKTQYSILVEGKQYMQITGTFIVDKLEVNKEDNYVVCQIDIHKRS